MSIPVGLFLIAGCAAIAAGSFVVHLARDRRLRLELDEHHASFDLRWKADMRAIKAWQAAHPGKELVWPSHVDLVLWLFAQLYAEGPEDVLS